MANEQAAVANQAPAVSTDSPFRIRRRELEKELKTLEAEKSDRNKRARATTSAMIAELKRLDDQRGHSRLHEMTPVGNLLIIPNEVQEKYPDDHLRWVNETIPGRPAFLNSIGYERVPGQVSGGDLVLWRTPRSNWANRTAAKEEKTDRELRRATSGSREEQTSKLQEFFDKQGIDVDVRRLILGG